MIPALFLTILAAVLAGTHQPATPQQPDPDITVRSIHHDTLGRYWFGTSIRGVFRTDDHDTRQFTTDDGLTHNQVRSIHEDTHGTIWFETAEGLSTFRRNTLSSHDARNHASPHTWRLSRDDLWFKGGRSTGVTPREATPGAYRYDGATLRYQAFPFEIAPSDHGLYSVTAIHQPRNGRLWIATYNAVLGYDGETFTRIDNETLGLTDETETLHVRSVFEDSKGRLWIGNNGIGVLLREGEKVSNFSESQGASSTPARDGTEEPPSLSRVFAIGEDRQGNIWFGTRDHGAWRYDGTTLRQFTDRDGLATNMVWTIKVDRHGDLLLGGQGVFRFDGTRFERIF